MTGLTLLPAVDVTDGHAVQLVQGVAGSGGQYGDPMEAALAWQRAGASWIHLVDLDAAFGRGSNAGLLADVVRKIDVQVEMSGGIRDEASLARALGTGCARVNIGTAALENPDWVRSVIARHGERVAVGLDVRGTRLAARGWTAEGGELHETLARLNAMMPDKLTFRSHAQVERFFAGLDLVDPGVVRIPEWRPDSGLDRANPAEVWGGVARKS